MPHRSAFMDDFYTRLLQTRQVFGRVPSRGFDDLDSTVDNGVDVFGIGWCGESRHESQVDVKRLVGHFMAAGNFPGQVFRRRLRQAGDDTQSTCLGHGRGQLGVANLVHASLDNRVLDTK